LEKRKKNERKREKNEEKMRKNEKEEKKHNISRIVYLPVEYNVLVSYLLTRVIQHTQKSIQYNVLQVQYVYQRWAATLTVAVSVA
jgi:hypothetical protein